MISISLCMIVKDEETVLPRCLKSVEGIFDETIIVDTGSSDKTADIAKAFGARVFDFKWIDDFAAARNFSFECATLPYCMWLDADDVLLPKDRDALLKLKAELTSEIDVVMLRYNTGFDEHGNVVYSYYRERILKKGRLCKWVGFVHEVIAPYGNIMYSEASVSHSKIKKSDSSRNLRIYEKHRDDGYKFSPRDTFYFARELYYHNRFEDSNQEFQNFLASGGGWVENEIEACRFSARCHHSLGDSKGELSALLQSLVYDAPRAEICCDIGSFFLENNKIEQAVFWYKTALSRQPNLKSGGFVEPDCYGYIPAIQLCVCFYRLGDIKKAIAYNTIAGKYKQYSEAVKLNNEFFKQYG